MYRLRMGLCPLLGAALLAGCSDRGAVTAPSPRLRARPAALVDRPYTWSVTCTGDALLPTMWSWTQNGTVLASSGVNCSGTGESGGTGVRPTTANGFTATLGDNSKTWTFDPAGPFKASLSGSVGGNIRHHSCSPFCVKESGQLSVDS